MTTRSRATAAALLALMVLSAVGCRSTNLSASELPADLLAPSGAGMQRIELRGLSSVGGISAAIGPADLLELTVVTGLAKQKPEPVIARVRDDGAVEAPYIGPVFVSGMEPTDAAEAIARAAIERGIYVRPQVQVGVKEQATYRVTVLGAVADPGVQEVPRTGCDILSAVAAAGGFTDESGTIVEVLRHAGSAPGTVSSAGAASPIQQASFEAPALVAGSPEMRTETYDLSDPGALPIERQELRDRDVVIVRPKEVRVVHVSGLVQRPDQFELTENHDLRVLDAIAMAGGVSNSIADKVVLIRHIEGRDKPVVIELSLAGAKRDGTENLVLQSGDLISVEQTVATAVLDTFNTLFRISLGLGGNLSVF